MTITTCSRCLYDNSTIKSISFDRDGVCNYCRIQEQLEVQYPNDERGEAHLRQVAEKIKEENKGKQYDVVVGVSGGCDSSYMVHLAKQLGLRPLAVHFDNTWNSTVATENIHAVLEALDVDLYTYVVDNNEYDDILRSFLLSGVKDIETPTDIGLAAVLYMACEKYDIKYIFEGHSFRSEGVAPLDWIYMDQKYIDSVHKEFGRRPMKTFPGMPMHKFLKWVSIDRIKKIRPLYHHNYQKKEVMEFLKKELNWTWYGGHHLENRYTAFFHSYFLPRRWGIDTRVLGYSALIRSKQMTREEGLDLMTKPIHLEAEIVGVVKKRFNLTDEEFDRALALPKKTYRDYKTYKPTFEKMRPFFWALSQFDLVPKSFYLKYTAPDAKPSL